MPSLTVPPETRADRRGCVALRRGRACLSNARTPRTSDFKLTDESAPIVAEICRRLDGIALAIELAAARVKVLTPRQLAQKLEERFRMLTGREPGGASAAADDARADRVELRSAHAQGAAALPAPRDLRRRLELGDGQRRLFRRRVRPVSDAIESWEVLDILSSLVDKSLVQAELFGSETRYRLLESTREYAHGQLVEHGEYEEIARAHAAAFLERADQLDRAARGDSRSRVARTGRVGFRQLARRPTMDARLSRRRPARPAAGGQPRLRLARSGGDRGVALDPRRARDGRR